jgi:tetratricopeptide (TPR) repeat protein
MYNIPFAEMYYKTGQAEKANRMLERLCEIYGQNLDYYYTFKGKYRDYYKKDIEQALGMLRRMNYLAKENKQDKLAAEADSLFNQKLKLYQ